MQNEVYIDKVPGRKLSQAEISLINQARLENFGSTVPVNPQPDNEDWNKLYFLAKQQNQLLAFGRLHNLNIAFQEESYPILGIATIIAITKGQGIGTRLIASIREYIQQSGLTGLGFCEKKLSSFYQNRGFSIIEDSDDKFVYPGPLRFPGGDAIYIDGKDKLMEKILKTPEHKAILPLPQW
jgi:hypothetical protein